MEEQDIAAKDKRLVGWGRGKKRREGLGEKGQTGKRTGQKKLVQNEMKPRNGQEYQG